MSWLSAALCNGANQDIFFEDRWKAKRIPFTKALEKARGFCDNCPARRGCFRMAMEAEKEQAERQRAGVYGGMTPQQRYSLEQRGTDYSAQDPVKLRKSIPDRGDQWDERHTVLARKAIEWLIDNTPEGMEAPSANKLARIFGVRVNDMRRVYQALRDDQIIVRGHTGALVRKAHFGASGKYLPPHLRRAR